MIGHYAHIEWGIMLIFNPIQDIDRKDVDTKYHWNPLKIIQVVNRTPNTHQQVPGFIKESVKHLEKYKYWNPAKYGADIMCLAKVS